MRKREYVCGLCVCFFWCVYVMEVMFVRISRINKDFLVFGCSNWIVGGVVYLVLEYGVSSFWSGREEEFSLGCVDFETFIRGFCKEVNILV